MDAPSKTCACGSLLFETAGSNPAGSKEVSLFLNFVYFVVNISVTGRFLLKRSRSDFGVSECDRETSIMWWPWPTRVCCVMKNNILCFIIYVLYRYRGILLLLKARGENHFNPSTPNDPYSGRIAPLTSKCCILYTYSKNIGTEYFKHGIYSPFFDLQNAVCFIILTYLVPVLFTFYIQGVLKFKK